MSHEAHPLRSKLRDLYFGHSQRALRFQGVLFVLDLAIVGFFIFSQFIAEGAWFWIVDLAIAAFLAFDMAARWYAFGTTRRWLLYPSTWADIVVLATLVAPPLGNLGFLRILRLWTVVHRERFWNVLGGGRWDDTHVEDVTQAVMTLVTFVFIAAGLTQFAHHHWLWRHHANRGVGPAVLHRLDGGRDQPVYSDCAKGRQRAAKDRALRLRAGPPRCGRQALQKLRACARTTPARARARRTGVGRLAQR